MGHDSGHRRRSFRARGGWWVAAQVPIMLGALLIPIWSGSGALGFSHLSQWLGASLTMLGGLAAIFGLVNLGDALTPYPHPRDGSALKQRGIYGWMRHPIYSGMMVGTVGWAIWWQSGPGLAYAAIVLLFFDRKAAREERWLRNHYPEYARYARSVKRFFPGIY